MTATPAGHDAQPPERRPLSEHEQQALRELEAHATETDPGLSMRLRRATPRWNSGISSRTYNTIVQVAVVYVLAIVVLPRPAAGVLIGLALALLPALLAVWSIHRDSQR
ncbi:DUF3040 domain-containing protein [Actinomycetospora cinnamomea]|uniref:DUF3040 family protein n=1 Tax=Actinomycetospora cinnamomea TaxID=663609 RepID=A0A2U1FCT9_9PSEU|nr:DUF3040 domain-containing protein [Actinomycetospora cinnamomea]PVZ10023.1 hypothetical protein C8D89_10599 [Actinomycetospora cinnamomea]